MKVLLPVSILTSNNHVIGKDHLLPLLDTLHTEIMAGLFPIRILTGNNHVIGKDHLLPLLDTLCTEIMTGSLPISILTSEDHVIGKYLVVWSFEIPVSRTELVYTSKNGRITYEKCWSLVRVNL